MSASQPQQLVGGPVTITCRDGIPLEGHLWPGDGPPSPGHLAIINPATGVLARYYHRYAAFLAGHGIAALTYDYRGIGASRRGTLRGSRTRWLDWGRLDFDAAIAFATERMPGAELLAVGHSIGGVLIGAAPQAHRLSRIVTVGAQYAYWRDYNPYRQLRLLARWNVIMPALTLVLGYFPGRRLGWLEDLPPRVALEWALRRARLEDNYPPAERAEILEAFGRVSAPVVAIHVGDDDFASLSGIERALRYYVGSAGRIEVISPSEGERIGHFGFFHERHRKTLWQQSLEWLQPGLQGQLSETRQDGCRPDE